MERNVPLRECQNLEQFKDQLTKFMLSLPDMLSIRARGYSLPSSAVLAKWQKNNFAIGSSDDLMQ